jgi:hypothetical protein
MGGAGGGQLKRLNWKVSAGSGRQKGSSALGLGLKKIGMNLGMNRKSGVGLKTTGTRTAGIGIGKLMSGRKDRGLRFKKMQGSQKVKGIGLGGLNLGLRNRLKTSGLGVKKKNVVSKKQAVKGSKTG